MLWPKIEYESDGYMLAASHAIGTNEVMEEEVAAFLGEILLARYPELLTARYGFTLDGMDGPAVVEAVARRRGCLVKGGGLDLEKAALILLDDYRSGTLGRISLETPETRSAMMASCSRRRRRRKRKRVNLKQRADARHPAPAIRKLAVRRSGVGRRIDLPVGLLQQLCQKMPERIGQKRDSRQRNQPEARSPARSSARRQGRSRRSRTGSSASARIAR